MLSDTLIDTLTKDATRRLPDASQLHPTRPSVDYVRRTLPSLRRLHPQIWQYVPAKP